jgi:hypothetical protein
MMKNRDKDKLLTEKLNFIIDNYIDGGAEELALKTFGYERQNTVSNLRSYSIKSPTIRKIHMESIKYHYQIPLEIWSDDIAFDENFISKKINEYRLELKKEKIYKERYIEYNKRFEDGSLKFTKEDTIFKKNQKLFDRLKGVWYAYLYPSNPASASETDGVWIVETTIYDDYSVVDYWGNRGYLKLGKHESLIIKESYDNDDLTVIRFPNRQIPSKNFRFVIVSNQNNTTNEMVNFGFYSRVKYSPKEAKEILGDMKKVQLKLDLDFNARINRQGVVPS